MRDRSGHHVEITVSRNGAVVRLRSKPHSEGLDSRGSPARDGHEHVIHTGARPAKRGYTGALAPPIFAALSYLLRTQLSFALAALAYPLPIVLEKHRVHTGPPKTPKTRLDRITIASAEAPRLTSLPAAAMDVE